MSDRRDGLGPEVKGTKAGPTHRPGQPCTYCHDGSDEQEFAVAGTVFTTRKAPKPVQGARVTMTDANGSVFVAETNCAGNFFVRPKTWAPVFPLKTTVNFKDQTQTMESPIHREGGCGVCHGPTTSPTSAGPIYLWDDVMPPPAGVPGGCP